MKVIVFLHFYLLSLLILKREANKSLRENCLEIQNKIKLAYLNIDEFLHYEELQNIGLVLKVNFNNYFNSSYLENRENLKILNLLNDTNKNFNTRLNYYNFSNMNIYYFQLNKYECDSNIKILEIKLKCLIENSTDKDKLLPNYK